MGREIVNKTLARMSVVMVSLRAIPRTLLPKMLFLADALSMAERGRPISDALYLKTDHGPQPALFDVLREKLVRDGVLRDEQEDAGSLVRHVMRLTDAARYDLARTRAGFSADDLDIIERVAEAFTDSMPLDVSRRLLQTSMAEASDWFDVLDLSLVHIDTRLRRLMAPTFRTTPEFCQKTGVVLAA